MNDDDDHKKIIFNYSQLKAVRTHNLMKFINDKQNNNKRHKRNTESRLI